MSSVNVAQKSSKVAFGSCLERKLYPIHHPPTRAGIEHCLRGQPHLSPGCYQGNPVILLTFTLYRVLFTCLYTNHVKGGAVLRAC